MPSITAGSERAEASGTLGAGFATIAAGFGAGAGLLAQP